MNEHFCRFHSEHEKALAKICNEQMHCLKEREHLAQEIKDANARIDKMTPRWVILALIGLYVLASGGLFSQVLDINKGITILQTEMKDVKATVKAERQRPWN